jgi:hypothetical protein
MLREQWSRILPPSHMGRHVKDQCRTPAHVRKVFTRCLQSQVAFTREAVGVELKCRVRGSIG